MVKIIFIIILFSHSICYAQEKLQLGIGLGLKNKPFSMRTQFFFNKSNLTLNVFADLPYVHNNPSFGGQLIYDLINFKNNNKAFIDFGYVHRLPGLILDYDDNINAGWSIYASTSEFLEFSIGFKIPGSKEDSSIKSNFYFSSIRFFSTLSYALVSANLEFKEVGISEKIMKQIKSNNISRIYFGCIFNIGFKKKNEKISQL